MTEKLTNDFWNVKYFFDLVKIKVAIGGPDSVQPVGARTGMYNATKRIEMAAWPMPDQETKVILRQSIV